MRLTSLIPSRKAPLLPFHSDQHVLPTVSFMTPGSRDSSDGNDDDDDEFDDEDDDEMNVTLYDHATQRSIECSYKDTVEIDDVTYYLCYPESDVVFFATYNERQELVAIEDQKMIDDIFPTAYAVLAEEDITLINSAYVLTIEEMLDGDDEDSEDDDEEDEGEEGEPCTQWDQVNVLAQFKHEGNSVLAVKPLDVTLLIAKDTEDGIAVLSQEELKRVTPALEEFFEQFKIPPKE